MFIEIRAKGKKKKYYLSQSYRVKGKIKKIVQYLGVKLSEEEIKQYRRYEQQIEILHLQKLNWKRFTESFTYNTNAIEGSTVALSEVKELLEHKEKPQNADELEALNVAEAVEFIQKVKEKLSLDVIKNIHNICFKGTKSFAGKLRSVEVVIKDREGNIIHRGASATEVVSLLKDLCKWYGKHIKKYPPLLLAALVHNQFENIHPFQDGNGRVGRLLLNYV